MELIYNNGKWEFAKYKIVVNEEEKFENDLSFYNEYKKIHSDFEFTATELIYTNAQLNRLATVNKLNANNGDYDEIYNFVMAGEYDVSSDTFTLLKPAQNRADIDYIAMESGVEL